jgi:thiamine biosynthesis lipoprotein ApbE
MPERRPPTARFSLSARLLFAFVVALPALGLNAPPAAVLPVRGTAPLLGETLEIEARGLAPAKPATVATTVEAAVEEALREAGNLARDLEPAGPGSLAALNAAAGSGPRPVAPRLLDLLRRALDFCHWSERTHGPLGRDLFRLWGVRIPVASPPTSNELAAAVAAADCSRLQLDTARGTAALAAGSGLDLRGFTAGAAVDRAVEILQERGVATGLVRLGGVWRGYGAGPDGRGWALRVPALPGQDEPIGPVYLRDRALARLSVRDRPLHLADEELASLIHQRTGRPAAGTLAVITATDRAVDAEALAVTLLLTGPREGQLRLGSLQPRPVVLWALGSGEGPPLLVEYRWSELPKR